MNCSQRLGERIRGTMGTADPYAGIEGENPYKALQRSDLDCLPEKLELGPHPVEPLAVPGITKLV